MASVLPRCRPFLRSASRASRARIPSPSVRYAKTLSKPNPPNKDDPGEVARRRDMFSANLNEDGDEMEESMIASHGWDWKAKLSERRARAANGELDEEEIEAEQNAKDKDLENMRDDEEKTQGFFAMDEERNDASEDPEFEQDDISSLAHGELEQHRELREFYRIIAWDMPLLYNHRKEFEPPTAATPLRFRYTSYLGETHPAANKVVCDFSPSAIPDLTKQQSDKLIKLLGVRYNPMKDSAKLSCEMFPTPAQNKRYLGDLVEKLIDEAKNGKDKFEDVPFDFRHVKPKRKVEFPEEWKMTEERMQMLEAKRAGLEQRQLTAQEQGLVVEGATLVREASMPQVQRESGPMVVQAQSGRSAPLPRQRTTLR